MLQKKKKTDNNIVFLSFNFNLKFNYEDVKRKCWNWKAATNWYTTCFDILKKNQLKMGQKIR